MLKNVFSNRRMMLLISLVLGILLFVMAGLAFYMMPPTPRVFEQTLPNTLFTQ